MFLIVIQRLADQAILLGHLRTVYLIKLWQHLNHVVTSQEMITFLKKLISLMEMVTTICSRLTEHTFSQLTVKQVTLLGMLLVIRMHLIIKNKMLSPYGGHFLFDK